MEVLFISHKYPPSVGGMQKMCFELVKGIERKPNNKVHTLCWVGGESKVTWFARLRGRVKKILRNHPGIEVIHLNDAVMGLACTWLADYTEAKVCVTVHGLDVVYPLPIYRNRLFPRLDRLDHIICVSRFTAEESIKRGISPDKVSVIYNGIDHQIAGENIDDQHRSELRNRLSLSAHPKRIILAVGRAVRRKGYSWFAREVLPRLGPDVLFVIAGPLDDAYSWKTMRYQLLPKWFRRYVNLFLGKSSDSKTISELLDAPELSSRLLHAGRVSDRDLVALYDIADIMVMPNIQVEGDAEGFGLVALEANMRETPVVAADLEGIKDSVINQKNGIRLPSADADMWVDTMSELLDQEHRCQSFGKAAKIYAMDNFSWAKMADDYFALFDRLRLQHKSTDHQTSNAVA